MTEEEKKAIELIHNFENYFLKYKDDGNKANLIVLGEEIEAIETVLNLLEKKEKSIDKMAEWLYEDDSSFGYGNLKDINTPEKIKQYFERKVEND